MITLNQSTLFKRLISLTLYTIDCMTYITSFVSLFIFITLISFMGEQQLSAINTFLNTIITIQCIRPILIYFIFKKPVKEMIKELGITFILLLLFILHSIISSYQNAVAKEFFTQLTMAFNFFLYIIYLVLTHYRVQHFLSSLKLNIFRSFITSFFFLIIFGTWLLSLPISRTTFISLTDLFFNATSAVTVTGLSTISLASDLTFFGQFVFAMLIQVGGLGIITFSIFFVLNTKQRLGFEERNNTLALFNQKEVTEVRKIVYTVLISTFIIEALGAIILFFQIPFDVTSSTGQHWFYSIFFSIAAFCNAGFSLLSNGVIGFNTQPSILYTLSFLSILGGLSFILFFQIHLKVKSLWQKNLRYKHSLNFYTKIILIMTIIFTLIGFFSFALLEWNASLSHFNTGDKLHNAFFQGINTRVGGFNSVNVTEIKPVTLIIMDILMFIGGAPGSTAGGLKITTFCIILITIFNLLNRQSINQINFLKYKIGNHAIYKAFGIFFLRITLTIVGVLFLSLSDSYLSLHNILFETTSSLNNTGYNITNLKEMSSYGKYVLMILMFIGRIGVFYLFNALFYVKNKKSIIEYKDINLPLE